MRAAQLWRIHIGPASCAHKHNHDGENRLVHAKSRSFLVFCTAQAKQRINKSKAQSKEREKRATRTIFCTVAQTIQTLESGKERHIRPPPTTANTPSATCDVLPMMACHQVQEAGEAPPPPPAPLRPLPSAGFKRCCGRSTRGNETKQVTQSKVVTYVATLDTILLLCLAGQSSESKSHDLPMM